ncbi:prephenate dehydratase, ACT domain protein [Artemisia annua]|uniref:Prephenate dehydratase, ACT domain protein n=1 Tax=Artemisia annua TaxID=35608 RepID=A0A2U1KMU1_ARTAN|nr:prephenate dehydratase, ACT domain protein [Artemisia annua]
MELESEWHTRHGIVYWVGVSGAYSESAAEKAYPNCETVPCEQFDILFQVVENWTADRAVLPIENSLGGSIHRNYDLLLRHGLHIVGERGRDSQRSIGKLKKFTLMELQVATENFDEKLILGRGETSRVYK